MDGVPSLSVDRAIMTGDVATPRQRERLRDAALGGALTQHRLLQTVITVLALAAVYAILVFRESALVNTLEAGRIKPPGFAVIEPASITWRTLEVPTKHGHPTSLTFDETRGEFQLVMDSGQFVRVMAKSGAISNQKLPFLPGPDLPVVLQPGLLRNYWPGIDGKRAFFLTAENKLATVDAGSLRVIESTPALPDSGAPKRFSTPFPFCHVAFDSTSDRLVAVVRDRNEGKVLSFFQFDEPKRGFGTLQHFVVDGHAGVLSYAIDGIPGIRQLSVSEGGILTNERIMLAQAPFPAGSTEPQSVWELPLRRLGQFMDNGVGMLAQVQDGPTVALRPESPMLTLIQGTGKQRESGGYFPSFQAMPTTGLLPTANGVMLVGGPKSAGEIAQFGVEVLDFRQKTVSRSTDFERGSIRIPGAVAAFPLLATSPDGKYLAVSGPDATQIWVATIEPQKAEIEP